MFYTYSHYQESADYLRRILGDFSPQVLLILGSGLGELGNLVETPRFVPYEEIPHFQASTAPGHSGRFVFGTLCGKSVAVMQGRLHTYEGYSMAEVAYPVRVLRLLGAQTLLVTNAAGAVNESYSVGEVMLLKDHIKLFDSSPLWGQNLPEFGVRFPDLCQLYTPRLRELAKGVAQEEGIALQEGVYMYFPGPQYETPAEIRAARTLGADAVGMSTVPEAIVAAHCGMEVLGFSLCSNMAAGMTGEPLSEQEVLDTANASHESFSRLVLQCLHRL